MKSCLFCKRNGTLYREEVVFMGKFPEDTHSVSRCSEVSDDSPK